MTVDSLQPSEYHESIINNVSHIHVENNRERSPTSSFNPQGSQKLFRPEQQKTNKIGLQKQTNLDLSPVTSFFIRYSTNHPL